MLCCAAIALPSRALLCAAPCFGDQCCPWLCHAALWFACLVPAWHALQCFHSPRSKISMFTSLETLLHCCAGPDSMIVRLALAAHSKLVGAALDLGLPQGEAAFKQHITLQV